MKKIIFFIGLIPVLALGQDQNYVKAITYKQATLTSVVSPTIDVANVQKTYLDGLGRPIQQVSGKQSNTGKDIITHIEYDAFGLQVKEYLPFPSTAATLNYDSNAQSNTLNYSQYTGQNPFSEKLLEASPLGRVLKQGAPGTAWALGSGHEIKLDYQLNKANEVKLFKATAIWNATLGLYETNLVNGTDAVFYDANKLYKIITKDENWVSGSNNTTEEFKDKDGRVVLKKTYNNGDAYETYYVYDPNGNLTYVIPPIVAGSVTPTVLEDLCYQYKYDYRNRLVEKKLPGKQWEFIVYDLLDRVRATGPAFSPFTTPSGNGWLITKYDVFNRVVLTAWMSGTTTSAGRKILQDDRNRETANFSETKIATATNNTINGIAFRYSNVSFPTSGYHVLTISYYDDYNFPNAPIVFGTVAQQNVYYNTTIKPKGLATGSWVRVLETATLYKGETAYSLYDYKARPIRSYTKNYLDGYTQTDTKLDFAGVPQYSITTHKRIAASIELKTTEVFTYTPQGRLLTHTHQIGSAPVQLLSKNTYDELGQLVSKNVGGTDVSGAAGLQKVDYNYNIRGWLKGINDTSNLSQGTAPQDLFSFKLSYNDPTSATALYNGNISETFWRTSSDNILRKYNYSYDHLNRLTDANYQKPDVASTQRNYDETLTYDKGGNILALTRTGDLDSDGEVDVNVIDDLIYTYHNEKKNQLMKVLDFTNSPQGFRDDSNGLGDLVDDYRYDINGNMVGDANKGIDTIKYNHLNLPVQIKFYRGETINYIYNALGRKVKKMVTGAEGPPVDTTDYLEGFQYKNTILQFFPHAEGYVKYTSGSYNYVFNYTDHLGNVRLSYGIDPGRRVLKIIEENHYYPFGLKHTNYNSDELAWSKEESGTVVLGKVGPIQPLEYKYKYNGKEYQDELGLNMYAMDMRQYDPAIGRWVVQDPIVHFNFSPYNAFDNNPVFWADPSGAAAEYNFDGPNKGKYMDGDKEVSFADAMGQQGLNENGSEKEDENDNDKGKNDNNASLSFDNPMMNVMNPKDDIRKYEKNKKTIARNTIMLEVLEKFTASGQLKSSMESAVQDWFEATGTVFTPTESDQMLSDIDDALNDLGVEITTAAPSVKIAAAIISAPLMTQNIYLSMQNDMYLAPRILKDSPAYYNKHIMPVPPVGGPYHLSGGGSGGSW